MDGVAFLGFQFVGYGGQIRVSTKNIGKFKDRVREITRRNRGVSMRQRFQDLRRYFHPPFGYLRIALPRAHPTQLNGAFFHNRLGDGGRLYETIHAPSCVSSGQ